MAIRPLDPPPVILTSKKREAKLEYQRQKEDAFNKLPPEEQAKILARREKRQRGTPQGLLKRIVAQLAIDDNRYEEGANDAIMAELTANGVTGLVLNAIRTQGDRRKGRLQGEGQEATVRIGARAVRVFMKCKTGELVESWNADKLIR